MTGTPTLSLNDGGTATYAGGSGTGTLTFKTTVASTNTATSALAITGVNLASGVAIKDASGCRCQSCRRREDVLRPAGSTRRLDADDADDADDAYVANDTNVAAVDPIRDQACPHDRG